MATARITSKGQVTIPKEIRTKLGVQSGDSLEFLFNGEHLEVRPKRRRSILEFRGLFAVPEALPFEEERARAEAARAREWREKLSIDAE